jgi:exportin-2 (importin alpha re-exporter)
VIPDAEKEQVKSHITDLMLSAPPRVRSQLSEALSIISSHDFPARWQSLLPHLVDKLASPDPQLVNGVLSTADSIYQRYRCEALGSGIGPELWGAAVQTTALARTHSGAVQ